MLKTINRAITEAPVDACFAVFYAFLAVFSSVTVQDLILNALLFGGMYELVIRWQFTASE